MSLDQCQDLCRKNCSCLAYSDANITDGGSGCVIWTTALVDMRQYAAAEGGQDLHVRAAASVVEQAGATGNDSNRTQKIIKVAGITVGIGVVLAGFCIFFIWKRMKSRTEIWNRTEYRGSRERSQDFLMNAPAILNKRDFSGESTVDEVDLPLYDFSTIVMATDKFSDANKLGQGGFGCVYKGILVEGQEIAVKRLSKNSGQGIEEFKNEMKLIARLQHRNLVRLLGCCVDMEEKMLVYEYMENKSLDSILFKKEKSSLLDWKRRIFGGDQTEANTKRVVGTYGYMSPEYAMDGLFSMKSDVFSFGVLVLEIVSGKKNRGFYHTNNQLNLLAHAWRLWREGRGMELMDSAAGESYSSSEVLRCIQVGLLCVQEQAEDRPNMDTVVLMLSSDTASMSQPKNPGFCLGRRPVDTESSSSKQDESCTVNQVTVTILDGR
ncbi:unnamed protein product [Fraxinus pennsylvanica]|uniref:Uncharacterized protein n=1 Tax=Fraxinus pennsylvanica TaxID=56036 RepID=A0AAD1YT65_9LAMI|nr:unnamed protein product [Fraxinus pennsylvanica]